MKTSLFNAEILESMECLATDARARLKAGRGCPWAEKFIVAAASFAEQCKANEGFYCGRTPVEPDRLLASHLQKRGGLLGRLPTVFNDLKPRLLPDEQEQSALRFAFMAVEELLNTIVLRTGARPLPCDSKAGFLAMFAHGKDADSQNRGTLEMALGGYRWFLGEAAYRLTVIEYGIWFEHRDWKIPCEKGTDPRLARQRYDNLYKALKRHDEEHADGFLTVRTATEGLAGMCESLPIAFVDGLPSLIGFVFVNDVKETMTLPTRIVFGAPAPEAPEKTEEMEPSEFLTIARLEFLDRLNALLQERAAAAKSPEVRRKWYEAAAEMLSLTSWNWSSFTFEQADRVIALVNAAQRESWIESRMKSSGAKVQRLPVELSERPPRQSAAPALADTAAILRELFAQARAKPAPVARRPSRKGRRGSGLMGPRTRTMKIQLAKFVKWLETNPVNENVRERTVGSRAGQYWWQNRVTMKAAAKRSGEQRGYSCAKALADAYRKS